MSSLIAPYAISGNPSVPGDLPKDSKKLVSTIKTAILVVRPVLRQAQFGGLHE